MMPSTIGFDATPATQGAGVGRYSLSLLQALLAREDEDRLVLVLTKGVSLPSLQSGESKRDYGVASLPISTRWLDVIWQRLRIPLPLDILVSGIDVFHSPNYTLPPLRRAKAVVTVHDLSFLRVPQYSYPNLKAYLSKTVPKAVARAEAVLADSLNTAQDLVELLNVPEERIVVAYPGVNSHYHPNSSTAERRLIQQNYGLFSDYVLTVGTIEPRKNYPAIIQAFKALSETGLFAGQLAIVGATGWMAEESLAAAHEAGDMVRLLGRVPESDLPALYRNAKAFVFAPYYEGFGIPPLEAMACGIPVLVSNNSSLPEVVAEAGLYCGVDPDSILAGMAKLVQDDYLRKTLIQAGLEQASRFSWAATAEKVTAVYHEVG